ncbi:MAG: HAD-IA family hydrolase [Rhodoferax sp.]|nr:HAD-IA family hydrolase [Rhodoferax sp.]MBP7573822.1 HAD-IA family hydrolase [Rhodoferax sp.]MBP8135435.1 HAD-IA family hydrolase [Rhodoferax sp.]
MLDISKVRAITLDLDDTLWPIWPTIERAEAALAAWLTQRAPVAAGVFANPKTRVAMREEIVKSRPDLSHDMSALRRESIRLALHRCGEDTQLAEDAFQVFFAERMRVNLYEDALPALAFLAQRFPIVALSNGNADVGRVGIGEYFHDSLSAHEFGVGKPDPRIFHAAAVAAGVTSDEVLHIGDDVHLDVLGALGAGMQTVWVNRGDHVWAHDDQPHLTVSELGQLCARFVTPV